MKVGFALKMMVLSLAIQAAAAPAGAGPRMKGIMRTITIDAPVQEVWARVGNFQDMSWHPDVSKTEDQGGGELGARRTLHLSSGGTIEQALIDVALSVVRVFGTSERLI